MGRTYVHDQKAIDEYLRPVAHLPLLTETQELDLGELVQRGIQSDDWRERDLANRARAALCLHNRRYAAKTAKNYQGLGLCLPEVLRLADTGLMAAATKYNPDEGNRFLTYATWWIKQAIFRGLNGTTRTIKIPDHRVQKLLAYRKFLKKCDGTRPDAELAEQFVLQSTNYTLEDEKGRSLYDFLIKSSRSTLSLDAMGGEDGTHYSSWFEDRRTTPAASEPVERNEAAHQLFDMLQMLPPRQAFVLIERYGIERESIQRHSLREYMVGFPAPSGTPQTLQEVGETLKLSREMIRQIEVLAQQRLLSLKTHIEAMKVGEYIPTDQLRKAS